jgi:hypothetical protein
MWLSLGAKIPDAPAPAPTSSNSRQSSEGDEETSPARDEAAAAGKMEADNENGEVSTVLYVVGRDVDK